jgi:hypothetical protein
MHLLRWLPARRAELLVSLLLILGCFALTGFLHEQFADEAALLLVLVTLEIILPLAMGLLSAGLLAGDPALDLLFSAHRPAWQTLLERLVFIGAVGVFLSRDLPLPKEGSAQMYIWLSPMVFYMGLASAVALLRGRMLDGALAALGVMGASLMMVTQIPRLCAGNPSGTPCLGWLASPMMTLGSPADAYWPLNRLFWLLVGVALLGLSLRLARREEPLLPEVSKE